MSYQSVRHSQRIAHSASKRTSGNRSTQPLGDQASSSNSCDYLLRIPIIGHLFAAIRKEQETSSEDVRATEEFLAMPLPSFQEGIKYASRGGKKHTEEKFSQFLAESTTEDELLQICIKTLSMESQEAWRRAKKKNGEIKHS